MARSDDVGPAVHISRVYLALADLSAGDPKDRLDCSSIISLGQSLRGQYGATDDSIVIYHATLVTKGRPLDPILIYSVSARYIGADIMATNIKYIQTI